MHPTTARALAHYRSAAAPLASALRSSSSPDVGRYYSPAHASPSTKRYTESPTGWENGAAVVGLLGLFIGSWIALREEAAEAAAETQRALPTKLRIISIEELRRHRAGGEEEGWWVAIDGKVFDVSSYASSHPIGPQAIEYHAGEDISALFRKVHKKEGTLERAKKGGVREVGRLESEGGEQ
ncbi:hypothetical protein BCR35DRAFT_211637 [Leucosporidium creatinivorum]|uniref:Cytochrome b5 heme-binding domain-containing protein n=1 Tax=Leucosporidium creatinivorum TaxID=106004 RepID=A0A1Y2DD35_9BASI|nr:hypothetical protein BCR35DRAFT_211637 [Leucosporidium creatinivorum]